MRILQQQLQDFLNVAGIEMQGIVTVTILKDRFDCTEDFFNVYV